MSFPRILEKFPNFSQINFAFSADNYIVGTPMHGHVYIDIRKDLYSIGVHIRMTMQGKVTSNILNTRQCSNDVLLTLREALQPASLNTSKVQRQLSKLSRRKLMLFCGAICCPWALILTFFCDRPVYKSTTYTVQGPERLSAPAAFLITCLAIRISVRASCHLPQL